MRQNCAFCAVAKCLAVRVFRPIIAVDISSNEPVFSVDKQCVRSLDIDESVQHCEVERRLTMDFSTFGLSQIGDEEKENQRPTLASANQRGNEQCLTSESLVERKRAAKKKGLLVNRSPSHQETSCWQHQKETSNTGNLFVGVFFFLFKL